MLALGSLAIQDAQAQKMRGKEQNPSTKNKTKSNNNQASEIQGFDRSRLFFEGNIGGNIGGGSGGSSIQILASPIIGYRFTNRLSAGAGPRFDYIGYNGQSLMIYGARAMGRYNITPGIFAHGEYEIVRSNRDNCGWRSHFPIGGGVRQRLGNGVSANFTMLYDLLYTRDNIDQCDYSRYSTYNGFILRGGISMGLGSGAFGRNRGR